MIDKKLKLNLGGLEQKIHIRTEDETLPVLLFLHGGPGVCNRHTIFHDHSDLLDTFTMVCWDQRGTGGSYAGAKKEDLTVDRVVEDGAELIRWLCKEFKKDKIFIIGGSWGSALGTLLAYRHPEHIAAYVGFGQMADGTKNEDLSYKFALEEAEKADDMKAVKALIELGEPVKGCYKGGYKGMMVQRNIMMKYGGYSKNEKKRSYFSSMVVPMLFSGEYSVSDLWGLIKGHVFVLETMWPEVGSLNLGEMCPEFRMPYYIFDGRLDQNTPAALVQEYFDNIKAPEKELIWFENSGHNPMNDEGERFKRLLREKLTAVKEREKNV